MSTDKANIIEVSKLNKWYGDFHALKNIDLNVKEGEIFGFIGPNGAGKSTTIRTMLSLIYPTSGTVTIFGKDAIEFGPEVRKEIGYLPSEIFYYDKMKVIDHTNNNLRPNSMWHSNPVIIRVDLSESTVKEGLFKILSSIE